jgi:hypothetical protein
MQFYEHRPNLKEGLLQISKSAQHAYKESYMFIWDEARILEIESNGRYKKYKELTHMACLTNLWGERADRIVYSRPHVACSSCPYIHTTIRSASGGFQVGWSAAWSVGRDLAIDENSVAAAVE